jgi:DNA (cytosine-5)-methyltransferase 1
MKVLSLFSGIGAFEKALENLGIETDLVGYCEIDKYAAKSYSAIHNVSEEKNLGDITKIDAKALPRDIDLITYGFPCQDISIAGKQKGLINEDGTQTRSGLFFEALRVIEETKPKVAIAENVKNLVGKKFNAQFQVVLASLEAAGYNNYWSVLNAKNYGVPQNRERVFIVSIRKDIDRGLFQFPVPIALNKRLKDVLEEVVDEKYYLNGKGVEGITRALTDGREHKPQILIADSEYAPTIDTRVGAQTHRSPYIKGPAIRQVGQMSPNGGNRMPKVAVCIGGIGEKKSNGGTQWYQQDRVYQGDIALAHPSQIPGGSYRYAVEEPIAYDEQNGYIRKDGCVGTIMTDGSSPKKNNRVIESGSELRIRKLTPKECFRLMGFDDESFHKAEAVNSNSQLYKQAGNSIVVNVLEAIFRQMLDENGNFTI